MWVAEQQRAVIGLGELTVRSQLWRQGEVGYAVHVSHWGRGLGTAIARSLLTIAFDSMDLHRVMATCDPRNLASAAVLHKVGMTFEGRLRHTMMIRDGWRDSSVFSILADEWQARRDQGARSAYSRSGHPAPAGQSGCNTSCERTACRGRQTSGAPHRLPNICSFING